MYIFDLAPCFFFCSFSCDYPNLSYKINSILVSSCTSNTRQNISFTSVDNIFLTVHIIHNANQTPKRQVTASSIGLITLTMSTALALLSLAALGTAMPTQHENSADGTDAAKRPPPSIWYLDCPAGWPQQQQCQEARWRCGPTANVLYPGSQNPAHCEQCGCRVVL